MRIRVADQGSIALETLSSHRRRISTTNCQRLVNEKKKTDENELVCGSIIPKNNLKDFLILIHSFFDLLDWVIIGRGQFANI